ncbi:hypothetical protein CUR178_04709 [Leishmania enriettii]|uniref:Uncharacterized protein n=1 Tax=Leishmania enriettii TaxID=5663 RepID=A0A836GXJ9_LEIEN|nr:hypothetical protein CUR178_04709 [Leishmania enriettii]
MPRLCLCNEWRGSLRAGGLRDRRKSNSASCNTVIGLDLTVEVARKACPKAVARFQVGQQKLTSLGEGKNFASSVAVQRKTIECWKTDLAAREAGRDTRGRRSRLRPSGPQRDCVSHGRAHRSRR